MKNKNKFIGVISLIFSVLLFVSCTEESPIESEITFFPTFEYEELVTVAIGSSFTPGAIATADGVELAVTISGSADTNTVGVYTITYSATNADGFDGTARQEVVVHDPSIIGTDISGNIEDINRTERTGVISLVPGTTSIFLSTDFGYSNIFPVYFQMDGDTISSIPQTYVNGSDANQALGLIYDTSTKEFTVFVPAIDFTYTFRYQ